MTKRPYNPNLPADPVNNPHPNPYHSSYQVQHKGGVFNPNFEPDRFDNPHPEKYHPSNRPHPNLPANHEKNNPYLIQNQQRFRDATDGEAAPYEIENISIDLPDTSNRNNPEVKVLQHGDKKIILSPDGIFMVASGTIVSLTDAEGITIISDGDIHLNSKDMLLAAGEEVKVVGMEGVELKGGNVANVKIEEDVLIEGNEVRGN